MALSTVSGRLVSELERWRESLGLNHRQFAAKLGIAESNWSLLRHGKRPVSQELAARIIAERPEFQYFWVQDVLERHKVA